MTRVVAALALLLAALTARSEELRFQAYEIVVDPGPSTLAAWQVEIDEPGWTIVGVEGGDAPFTEPAYYDPKALQGGRIVLAAFTTSKDVVAGAQRVAIVHVAVRASSKPAPIRVAAAADSSGRRLQAEATLVAIEEAP